MTKSAHADDIVASCPPTSSDAFYYPERTFFDPQDDERDKNSRQFLTQVLATMNEPSLSCGPFKDREAYRLLFIAAFRHPVAIRINDSANSIVLESTEMSGTAGGDGSGLVFEHKRIQLNERDWKELKSAIAASMFWNTTPTSSEGGVDGDTWIIEGRKGEEYHAATRWNPQATSFGNLGRLFFRLAGLTFPAP